MIVKNYRISKHRNGYFELFSLEKYRNMSKHSKRGRTKILSRT
jgi:hypothetical protein